MPVTVTVHIPASPEDVYARFADFTAWPEWNPACAEAGLVGDASPGSRVHLQLRHPRGRLFWTQPELTDLDPGRRLAWVTRSLGFRAPTETTFAPAQEGTHVLLRSWSHGPLAFSYRMMFPESAQGLLWSGALTGLARSFADG